MNSSPVAPPQRMPQVQDALASLGNLLVNLHDTIGRLESRLEIVTQPAPPSAVSESPSGHTVALVGNLSSLCCGLRGADERLRSLFDRLEV